LRSNCSNAGERLHEALHCSAADASLSQLLNAVDTALSRIVRAPLASARPATTLLKQSGCCLIRSCAFVWTIYQVLEQRALESDLSLAARIQRRTLPKADFAPVGWDVRYHYQPAGMVSGDYCDLFETDAGCCLCWGMFPAKGVAASMLMSHLRATFRVWRKRVCRLIAWSRTPTAFFCESTLADNSRLSLSGAPARDGAVEFVSAGHLPVLHLHSDGATPKEATGVPLGMFGGTRFPVHRLTLENRDTLLLYYRWLTESRNGDGAEYGLHRIRALAGQHRCIDAADLISKCLADLTSFGDGSKQTDDLTLLAVRRGSVTSRRVGRKATFVAHPKCLKNERTKSLETVISSLTEPEDFCSAAFSSGVSLI